ncbi:glmz-inactivating ntpase [Diplodia corticola]|uniref:Glmz-inactivating ntpase n=1 Tax=Diplodia corticola TaxID=236234 RepID=A0A1J9S5V2_9PEZI|nr:glmz-inactivating ntpase [Diplodia corticola]OJD40331.1 glmz-inactivating ntpase [Diplodia corticola]
MSRAASPQDNVPRYTLCLVSHSNSPPLRPEPAFQFDLHSVPNPPRAMRQAMTGKHRDLQTALLQDTAFCAELNRAYGIIKAAMTEFELSRRRPPPHRPTAPSTTEQDPDVLLVGCFCSKGKHRSPAFVESLVETEEWPSTWHVKAIHRELDDVTDKDNHYE